YNDLYANRTVDYEGADPGPGDISSAVVFLAGSRHDFGVPALQATTDRGDPTDDFSSEPAPNGGRVNLGAFGNTALAESSPGDPTRRAQGSSAGAPGVLFGGND